MKLLPLLALCLLTGCSVWPLRPGRASFTSPSGVVGTVRQSQNPKTESKQTYRRTQEGGKVTEEVDTVIGAAQKDVAREFGAKLASLRPVLWVGILVFLFGAASFVWPPLKVIVGSVTTSAVITGAGLAMIVLPTLIVGNEILIMGGAVAAAAIWWFSHRHGKLQGFVDANKDGIDDRRQPREQS